MKKSDIKDLDNEGLYWIRFNGVSEFVVSRFCRYDDGSGEHFDIVGSDDCFVIEDIAEIDTKKIERGVK